MKLNLEFFDNKRLLVVLSGVACIVIALVIFVMSVIGFGNIGAFLGGAPSYTETPTPNVPTPDNGVSTPTAAPTQTPSYEVPTSAPVTTPPTEVPTLTPDGTEAPTGTLETTPMPTEIPVTGIKIEGARAYTLTEGQELPLVAVLLPAGTKDTLMQWESTEKSVAVVDGDGLVLARGAGTTYIKVSAPEYEFFDQIVITVKAASTQAPTPTPTPTQEPTPTPESTPEVTPEPTSEQEVSGASIEEENTSQTNLEGNE